MTHFSRITSGLLAAVLDGAGDQLAYFVLLVEVFDQLVEAFLDDGGLPFEEGAYQ
ncbi:MAG: hypothetical protein H6558_00045 [Lewinellaceae bacterium]|nr:hypothetical protein [Lewinellaceae bacterium]